MKCCSYCADDGRLASIARQTSACPSAAGARSSRTRTWGTHTRSSQVRLPPARCSPLRPSWLDSVGMAEDRHRGYFWLRPTHKTPLALGLINLAPLHKTLGDSVGCGRGFLSSRRSCEPKRERRGLITKKPRIVRGSPAFLTDRARGKWAAGCLPNAAGVSWFLSSKGCGRGRARDALRSRPFPVAFIHSSIPLT
jgi:hypothetical protein